MRIGFSILFLSLFLISKSQSDSIPDKDFFNPSSPINSELSRYLNSPADIMFVPPGSNAIHWACGKAISKKSYWHQDKERSVYSRNFSCVKDKSSILITNQRKPLALNKDDKIIELSSSLKEPILGKNDFVGQSIKSLVERFGPTYIKKNNCLVYHNYADKILVLIFSGKKVIFYRFVWLNKPISSFYDIDPEILKTK